MIKIRNLYKKFGEQVVLDHINLDIFDGEIVAVLGESGSGKSVFLQHLIGLFTPDDGSIEIDGQDLTKLSERELLEFRKKIGYLFQEGALYDFMTVEENAAFPLQEHSGLKKSEIEKRVREILTMVGLEEAAYKYPSELSGGMKKRAALARAIVLGSKLLFCDEPTSGLDPIRSRDISDLIQRISRQLKCTTVMTSHDVHNSFRIADKMVIIREGRVISQGTPKEMEMSKDHFIAEFLS